MKIERYDLRDIEYEVKKPIFRVTFWSTDDESPSLPGIQPGKVSDEWRVSEAESLDEVVNWAQALCNEFSTFVVHLEVEDTKTNRIGIILLKNSAPSPA